LIVRLPAVACTSIVPLNEVLPSAVNTAFSGGLGWLPIVTVNVTADDEPKVTFAAVSEAGETEFDPCNVIDRPSMKAGPGVMLGVPDAMIT
jgi:hypothetical protein